MNDTRCGTCEGEFSSEHLEETNAISCPSCGTTKLPHTIAHDIELPINWHDVRCLVQWAENYILSCAADPEWERRWEAMKARINKHRPEGAPALTLMGEIGELRNTGLDVTLHGPLPQEGE